MSPISHTNAKRFSRVFRFVPVLLAVAALASAVPAHAQSPNTVAVINPLNVPITPYFKCPQSFTGCVAEKWTNFGQIEAYGAFTWDFMGFTGDWRFTCTTFGAPPPPDEGAKEQAVFVINNTRFVLIVLGNTTQYFNMP
jgi:hypothetical protein